MWDIVEWKNENAIDFVPTKWGNETKTLYKYPVDSSESKIRKMIYECKDLKDNYTLCEGILKKCNIKSLERAKELCKKGQITSTFESTDEDESSVRKRKKTRRLIEEDDEFAKKLKCTETQQSSSDSESELSQNYRETFRYPIVKPVNSSIHRRDGNSFEENKASSVSSDASTRTVSSNCTSWSVVEFCELLRNQAEIKFELKYIRKKLEAIENRHLAAVSTNSESPNDSHFIHKLPCNTIEDIQEVEEMIKLESNFNELVNMLYLLGGDTVPKTIYFAMKKLMTNELSVKYSGQGKKHKLAFCNLALYTSIIAVVRKRHGAVTDDVIKKSVALYLAQSKSRVMRKTGRASIGENIENKSE